MSLLYIPWFNDIAQTPESLKEILWKDNISELDLPWHKWVNKDLEYSLTSTSSVARDIFTEKQSNIRWVITCSISSWSVIKTILASESHIEKILLINPAFNPLASVTQMYNYHPRIQRQNLATQEDFLEEKDELFLSLVNGKVKWNAAQFRKDLHDFNELHLDPQTNFLADLERIKKRWQEIKILLNPQDKIIFWDDTDKWYFQGSEIVDDSLNWKMVGSKKISSNNNNLEVFYSHVPKFSQDNSEMIQEFFED